MGERQAPPVTPHAQQPDGRAATSKVAVAGSIPAWDTSAASAVPLARDGGDRRVRGPDQVGRGQLDLQAALAAAAVDRRELQRRRVDDHGQPPALPDRRDAADHVTVARSAAAGSAIVAFLPPAARPAP